MSFVSAAVAIGFEGVAANIAAGAMMGGAVKVGTNVISGQEPFKDIGKGIVMGGLTGGLTPGVAEAFNVSMPMAAGITQGSLTALATGDITKGLMAGATAYGLYGLTGAGQQAGLDQALSGTTTGGEQVFGDISAADASLPSDGSAGQAFNKYLTKPNLTGAATQANATGNFFKDNFKYLAAAAGPIMADIAAKNNMPQTVTKPGMIRPYSYDPYSGAYTAGNPYEVTSTKAAGGGLMGMNNGGYNPGDLNFAQRSEPVVRMAEGGVPGYANGMLVGDQDVFNYFKGLDQTKLASGALDAQIAADMQKYNVGAADIGRITGTQANQGNYEQRFVQAINPATLNSADFLAKTADVGLTDQALANAMKNAGMSQAAQYAATHTLNDAAGITGAPTSAQNLYGAFGYKAGDLKGDTGGIAGLYTNINQVAGSLQDQINAGKISVADAQRLSNAEMVRLGINQADIKGATGKDLFNLFTPKTSITCGPGYRLNAAGTACEPIVCGTGYHLDPTTNTCVKNIDATQNTSTNVTTPTSISTAVSTALPVGISGAGITTINPNGTVTTRPDLTLGMNTVRDDYVRGGGNLGYTSPTFASLKAVEDKYPLRGGSKQSYDYLTGKTDYNPVPYTKTGEIMKPYSESVLGIPMASSKRMYLFDPTTKTYKINPEYAIPTYDKDGKKSLNLTNADVKTFMDKKPSATDFYTYATTNNLSSEQVALASGRPINEISKLFTGAKDFIGTDGKIDTAKVTATETEAIKTNWDEAAYLAANPSVADELRTGKSVSGQPVQFTSGYEHWLKYGKGQGWAPTVKAGTTTTTGATTIKDTTATTGTTTSTDSSGAVNNTRESGGDAAGGLMKLARSGMSQQFDLGGYSDGGRLLRGPGDGVSDSIPATIGNKRPARLADGEFVVPARIVSELGNGSTEAGARKLYAMMDRVQAARRGTVGKGRVAKNSRSDKYLPA